MENNPKFYHIILEFIWQSNLLVHSTEILSVGSACRFQVAKHLFRSFWTLSRNRLRVVSQST